MRITDQEMQLWYHYEEIAMHFNQLIIQYRLQLMGGAGAIGALASYLIGSKVDDAYRRHFLRFGVAVGMLLIIFAAAVLDICYYDKLLQGAVDALLQFEEEHPEIYMSTKIRDRVGGTGESIIIFVYSLVIIPIGLFAIWSWRQHCKDKPPSETVSADC